MKKFAYVMAFSALALFHQGCKTIEKTPEEVKPEGKIEAEKISIDAMNAAKTYQQDFFKAISEKNHVLFCKNFIPELTKKYDKDRFISFCDAFIKEKGEIESVQYLGDLEIGLGRVFMWKIRFSKDFYKLKDGKIMRKDTLFSMLTGQVDGRLRVFDFSFK